MAKETKETKASEDFNPLGGLMVSLESMFGGSSDEAVDPDETISPADMRAALAKAQQGVNEDAAAGLFGAMDMIDKVKTMFSQDPETFAAENPDVAAKMSKAKANVEDLLSGAFKKGFKEALREDRAEQAALAAKGGE